jgi:hypothetical protein
MTNNNSNDRDSTPGQHGEGSQDALRHKEDAVHHKLHKGPPDTKDHQSPERAQQDSLERAQTPKLGSRAEQGG